MRDLHLAALLLHGGLGSQQRAHSVTIDLCDVLEIQKNLSLVAREKIEDEVVESIALQQGQPSPDIDHRHTA